MRVGTSDLAGSLQGLKQDHPHACGDKSLPLRYSTAISGSSPCVWGQVKDEVITSQGAGIIPMRVGTRVR